MFGMRALYHDGRIASTLPYRAPWETTKPTPKDVVNGLTWELFDLTKDWTQNHNLAVSNPAKLSKSCRICSGSRRRNTKYCRWTPPRSNGSSLPSRASWLGAQSSFTTNRLWAFRKETLRSILNRSFTITADVEVPAGGGDGMLATAGGRFGGWGFYLLKGKPIFVYNLLDLNRERIESGQPLFAGKHTVAIDFKYDGPGLAKGGTAAAGRWCRSRPAKFPTDNPVCSGNSETFDVGSTGTGVDDGDYQPPFAFTGKLNKLTLRLGSSGLSAAEWRAVEESAIKRD